MKSIIKFENGKIVFDTEGLKTKQKRNVLELITKNNDVSAALNYAASLATNKKARVYALSDLRAQRKPDTKKPKPNRIWNMFMQAFNVSLSKTPTTLPFGKAIGVEIEFFMPIDNLDTAPCGECSYCEDDREDECDSTSYFRSAREMFTRLCTERKIKGINIGEDGSINVDDDNEETALEARILTSIDDLSNLEAFCKVLSEVGAKVNKSCGLHVHLDMRDYERRPSTVVSRLEAALPLLRAMIPKSRVDNTYCSNDVGSKANGSGRGDRYSAINDLDAFDKFKTIEIRLHSGTVSFTKISNWIRILYSIARSEGRVSEHTIEAYASKFNWSAGLVAYIVTRIKKFNPTHVLLGLGNELGDASSDSLHEDSEAA
jgi:hypothetical protein